MDCNIKVFDEIGVFVSCFDFFVYEFKIELREYEIWNVICD